MESAGYVVESFASAEQFLVSASVQNAACLILDVELPGINGLELQDKLMGAHNHVPIVFVTAQGTQANRDKAMRRGASGFLSKPFRRRDLLKIIGEAIEH
jgi:two-component system, LuxR family, response regulator FixJ